ncbi:hypothetical protein QLL95_gp0804 [Cotonvirus japonicus]|uniref:Uncharacterized protein n=1 Tax=Cotonvirus japonicus TaxID=2811091 RepID=A0ABM7NT60_9VIRU|nr:hypothetical protein QLL95_gp0804 [Cotonvirus japonicus]BCS83319.1 hypothetical protein [Cotonvirus japonicus]
MYRMTSYYIQDSSKLIDGIIGHPSDLQSPDFVKCFGSEKISKTAIINSQEIDVRVKKLKLKFDIFSDFDDNYTDFYHCCDKDNIDNNPNYLEHTEYINCASDKFCKYINLIVDNFDDKNNNINDIYGIYGVNTDKNCSDDDLNKYCNLLSTCKNNKKNICCKIDNRQRELCQIKKKINLFTTKHKDCECRKKICCNKCELEEYLIEKQYLKEKLRRLNKKLENIIKCKHKLIKIINIINKKFIECKNKNDKFECSLKELQQKICILSEKNKFLICQNNKLYNENNELCTKLEKCSNSVKCVWEKYNSLKKKYYKCKKSQQLNYNCSNLCCCNDTCFINHGKFLNNKCYC